MFNLLRSIRYTSPDVPDVPRYISLRYTNALLQYSLIPLQFRSYLMKLILNDKIKHPLYNPIETWKKYLKEARE